MHEQSISTLWNCHFYFTKLARLRRPTAQKKRARKWCVLLWKAWPDVRVYSVWLDALKETLLVRAGSVRLVLLVVPGSSCSSSLTDGRTPANIFTQSKFRHFKVLTNRKCFFFTEIVLIIILKCSYFYDQLFSWGTFRII